MLVKANRVILSTLFVIFIGYSLYKVIPRNPPSVVEISQLIDKGIQTSELGAIHAGSSSDNPANSDTLCNCGEDQIRAHFLNDDRSKKEFNDYLKSLQPSSSYQSICQKYWQGWIYMSRQDYKAAIPLFNEVKSDQSNGALSQRAAHALLIAYLKMNNTEKAVEISDQIVDQPVHDQLAHNFAQKVKDLLK